MNIEDRIIEKASCHWGGPRITVKQMADYINAMSHEFTAHIQESWSSTDRQLGGSRLRSPGLGKDGVRLTVHNENGDEIFHHDTSETYRCNNEVALWIVDHLKLEVKK